MPITEFPPISPGNWGSANNIFLANWLTITKAANETRTSSGSILQDDTLRFPMRASTKYRVSGTIFFDTVANADFKYAMDSPGVGQVIRMARVHCAAGGTPAALAIDTGTIAETALTGAGTTGGFIQFNGVWTASSTLGYWIFYWAQNTSDPGDTTVLAGSYIQFQEVA